MRFLTARKNGSFVDLGQEYDGDKKPRKRKVEALVLGDTHFGEEDEKTMQANYEMIDELNPHSLVIHDLSSFSSISYHELKKPLSRAKQYARGKLFLEEDLDYTHKKLKELSEAMKGRGKIYIVHSNHDDFLTKYMESGMWRTHDL